MPGLGGEGHKFVPAQFLGARQQFATGVVSLARMTGASLIPVFCFKQDDGVDHLVLEKPINLESSGDGDEALEQIVTKYARLLESYIRKHPDQWYRWHNLPLPRRGKSAL